MSVENLITEHLDIWTSAIKTKSAAGRGSSKKLELVGIKKLRELILGLGLAGKLNSQTHSHPNDIDEQIETARVRYCQANGRKLKQYKISEPLLKEFDIPSGWKWARVCQLSDLQTGATPSRTKPENFGGTTKWLVSGDINRYLINDCEGRITEEGLKNSNCKILSPGTVMIALNGQGKTRATVALLMTSAACNQSLVGLTPFDSNLIIPDFLLYALKYRYYEIRDITGQNQRRGLNMALVAELSIPLPPISDQMYIVTKVDELMALCDQLEAQTENSIQAHQLLVETLLATLTNAKDADELSESWQRISQHFDVLFTTQDSIDQLKQTILQLAVMGKLVKQDPNDTPASEVLERIIAEEKWLNKNDKIKKQKPLPPITSEEKAFDLPKEWTWCRGETVADFVDPQPSHRTPPEVDGGVPYVGYTNIDHERGIDFDGARKVALAVFEEHLNRYTLKRGDFVFGKIGTLGQPYFLEEPFNYCLSANLILIQPKLNLVVPKFLALYLNSPALYKVIGQQKTNSTHGVFGIKKARLLLIPYPPLAEQKLIVDKVGKLLAICDLLEGSLNQVQLTKHQLTETLVKEAL